MSEEQKKRSPQITQERCRLAEYKRNDWVANVEYGVTVEDLLVPGFWAHVAQQMSPYDHIESRAEDGSWIAYLIVTECARTWARVAVDRIVKLTTQDVAESAITAMHEVKWRGPQLMWGVVRLSDRQALRSGFQKKDDAVLWMREHERVTSP